MALPTSPLAQSQPEAGTQRHEELVRFLVGTALIVGVVGSVALAILQWTVPRAFLELVSQNQLARRARGVMLGVVLGSGGAAALGLFVYRLLRPAVAPAKILRWGKLACPLLVAVFVPSLFAREPFKGRELDYLILLGVAGLLLEQFLRIALVELGPLPSWKLPDTPRGRMLGRFLSHLPFAFVVAGVVYYAVLIGHYTLATHVNMATATTDLGEYDNQFFNSLKGHPFRLPASEGELRDWSALKFHADFIIYALLPFYALRPGPETLLIMQTVIIAGTAIPIYLFGARHVPRPVAAVMALAFLLLPVVERPNFYDFHAPPIGAFFVCWTIFFVDRVLHEQKPRRSDYVLLWSAFVLALASREDIAFGMVIVSVFLLFYGKKPKLVLGMLASSLGYFIAIKFAIMPRFGLVWYHNVYQDIKAQGYKGYGGVVVTLLTNPVFVLRSALIGDKLLYLLHMLVPLLFLWIRRPHLWVAAVPGVFFTLMVTNRPPMYQSSFQYTFQWFPYIVVASLLALRALRSEPFGAARQLAATIALAFTATGAGFQYGVLLGGDTIIGGFGEKRMYVTDEDRARMDKLEAIAKKIPPEASVTATDAEGPHVSTRLVLYNLRYGLGDKPDYILFNDSIGGAEAKRVLEQMESGAYGVLDEKRPFILLKRGHKSSKDAKMIAFLRRR
jgi:uncharacterized membrane protein